MKRHVIVWSSIAVFIYAATRGNTLSAIESATKQRQGYRLVQTPAGIQFGLSGGKRGSPKPVAFLFGSLLRETLQEEHCRILRKLGFVCVALDAPGHGSDRIPGEPSELRSWRSRLSAGKNFVAAFNKRLSQVLDHLAADGVVDPKRVVAVGGSRGGFLAIHFAASEKRVGGVAALAPVTDLGALHEFREVKTPPLTQKLAVKQYARQLNRKNILVVIGDRDSRVGTDHAIMFARQVSRVAKQTRISLHVLPEPRGHAHPKGTNRLLELWAKSFLATAPQRAKPTKGPSNGK